MGRVVLFIPACPGIVVVVVVVTVVGKVFIIVDCVLVRVVLVVTGILGLPSVVLVTTLWSVVKLLRVVCCSVVRLADEEFNRAVEVVRLISVVFVGNAVETEADVRPKLVFSRVVL